MSMAKQHALVSVCWCSADHAIFHALPFRVSLVDGSRQSTSVSVMFIKRDATVCL